MFRAIEVVNVCEALLGAHVSNRKLGKIRYMSARRNLQCRNIFLSLSRCHVDELASFETPDYSEVISQKRNRDTRFEKKEKDVKCSRTCGLIRLLYPPFLMLGTI